ncbi:MAG TPA: ABC transporter substrate-binding protein, partial [Candidatus Paceibacterota bacterium]
NPLLAISDADRDLTTLIYSGLLRTAPDGTLIPDLASSYTASPDGLTYTVTLRKDATFQDGIPVTADDVVFTIDRAHDPAIKSPKRPNWDGITAEKADPLTVRFTLKQPYAPFLENLTLGILPKHLWSSSDPESFPLSALNIQPVGSGPYRVLSVKRDGSGVPVRYELGAFSNFALGKPYLSHITIHLYGSGDDALAAWNRGDIESMGSISSADIKKMNVRGTTERSPLPRIFAVFMNQNQAPIFAHKEVRQALDTAVNKAAIVEQVLGGYGTPIGGPIPPGTPLYKAPPVPSADVEAARDILIKNGWVFNDENHLWEKKAVKKNQPPEKLEFSLATSNAPELKAAAELLKQQWAILGVKVTVQVYETGDLNQNIIRPRKYDALLFGEIVGRELDLFAFWDSSQRNDPGLNVALYTSSTADALLESARTISNQKVRLEKYEAFSKEVVDDVGAIFLYAPDFLYAVPKNLQGIALGSITTPSDRFINVYQWYTETNRVWNFFAK